MCLFKAPAAPTPVAPAAVPTPQDPAVLASRERERRRQAAAAGSTNLTGGKGVQTPITNAPKTLLGE